MTGHDNHEYSKLIALGKFSEALFSGIRSQEKELLQIIHDQVGGLIDADNMSIVLYDELSDAVQFCLVYVNGKRVNVDEHRDPGTVGISKAEQVIRSGRPLVLSTRSEAENWDRQPGHEPYEFETTQSWMGVPMKAGDRILGVIATYHPAEEHQYTSQDREILQTIANQTALTLENSRIYQEARGEVVAAKQLSTLGTAIAALQHRINNTFNIIIPNVTRLKSRVDMTDPTVVEILDIIERNVRYTSNIIARIQDPLKEVEITDININAILGEIILRKRESWKAHVTTPFASIEFDADESIPIFRGSSGQIAEIFDNLLDNAHKALPKGGEIYVSSTLGNGNIMIRVRDSGVGIPIEIQDRLFMKPVPARRPGAGAGLGLWLSRLMLQTIGGDIAIEKSDETGTTMLVTIPVNQDKMEL